MPIPLISTIPLAKELSPSKSKIIVKKRILGCGLHLPTEISTHMFYLMAFEI